jgi:hypothetical protein
VAPVAGLQASVVQASLSFVFSGAPALQDPAAQASPVVQALPSSHGSVLGVKTQPVPALQESSVQALLSLQVIGVWLTPVAGLQASVVQTLLSSTETAVWLGPVTGSQASVVHALPSSVFTGV